jgi:hypothetical protein
MSAVGHAEAVAPAPAAELRTSLALACLGAALIHMMSAAHAPAGLWPAGVPLLIMGAVQGACAAALSAKRFVWAIGPAAALNGTLALSWGVERARRAPVTPVDVIATLLELLIAAGAVALLSGAGDRTLSRFSKAALLVFAIAAFTGFGHLGH